MMNFADRLLARIAELDNPTVLGLDPMLEYIPEQLVKNIRKNCADPLQAAGLIITEYNMRLIDSVADVIPAIKPQLAYYEQYGLPGLEAFHQTCVYAKNKGMIVIADGKRNDIGTTAAAYARAYLGQTELGDGIMKNVNAVDALTVNPYLGMDGIEPFLEQCRQFGQGIFILVRTSNPSAGDFQDLRLADDRTVYEAVADQVTRWGTSLIGQCGYSSAGAVVGATYPDQAAQLRRRMPHTLILVPGFGAQGATADDCAHHFDKNGQGAIVNASRSFMLAYKKHALPQEAFADACRLEAMRMKQELNLAIGRKPKFAV